MCNKPTDVVRMGVGGDDEVELSDGNSVEVLPGVAVLASTDEHVNLRLFQKNRRPHQNRSVARSMRVLHVKDTGKAG